MQVAFLVVVLAAVMLATVAQAKPQVLYSPPAVGYGYAAAPAYAYAPSAYAYPYVRSYGAYGYY